MIGIDLGIIDFNRLEKTLPANESVMSAGSVPIPKSTINNPPSIGFPNATAPAAATYVSPHGKKPFATPLKNHLLRMDKFFYKNVLNN